MPEMVIQNNPVPRMQHGNDISLHFLQLHEEIHGEMELDFCHIQNKVCPEKVPYYYMYTQCTMSYCIKCKLTTFSLSVTP